jgi:hypothetical protein
MKDAIDSTAVDDGGLLTSTVDDKVSPDVQVATCIIVLVRATQGEGVGTCW